MVDFDQAAVNLDETIIFEELEPQNSLIKALYLLNFYDKEKLYAGRSQKNNIILGIYCFLCYFKNLFVAIQDVVVLSIFCIGRLNDLPFGMRRLIDLPFRMF
jgi:hypothetical protein